MATQFAPLGSWADLPATIDEQADILRSALRIGAASRRDLGAGQWLERWEADLLLREARKAGPVAREAVVLLQARAAEWATHKYLVELTPETRPAWASLIDWALESYGEVRDSLASEPRHAVSAVEARLLDLKTRLAPRGLGLAPVVAWRSPSLTSSEPSGTMAAAADSSATSVMDRAEVFAQIAELDARDSEATQVIDRDAIFMATGEGPAPALELSPPTDFEATMVLELDAFADPAMELAELTGARAEGGATVAIDRDAFFEELAAYDARMAATEMAAAQPAAAPAGAARDDGSTVVLDREAVLAELGFEESELAPPVVVPSATGPSIAALEAGDAALADFVVDDLTDIADAAEVVTPAPDPMSVSPALDFDLGEDSELLAEAESAPAPTVAEVFDFAAVAAPTVVPEAVAEPASASSVEPERVETVPTLVVAAPPVAVAAVEADNATGSRRLLYAAAAAGVVVASGIAAAVVLP